MIIRQDITYYVQMQWESGEWQSIGAMDIQRDWAIESIQQKRESFPKNKFRLVRKTRIDEVEPEEMYVVDEEQGFGYHKTVAEGLKRHIRE